MSSEESKPVEASEETKATTTNIADPPTAQTAEVKSPSDSSDPQIGQPRRSTQIGEPPTLEAPPYTPTSGPVWPEIDDHHPLFQFEGALKDILGEADYNEVYGIQLDQSGAFHTKLILQKFLRANANDVSKAKQQLLETLKWRRRFQPLKCVDEVYSAARFEGLGYVTVLDGILNSPNKTDVVTFNIYGAVKDPKFTFEDLDGFLRWRVALMELGIQKMNLRAAKTPIPDYGQGPDPYQGVQVHDYLNISFLRMDPHAKAASTKTIEVFKQYYPETLSRKFFVNVPRVMGWMFSAIRLVLSKETVQKFTVLTFGKDLAGELGENVPEQYGGNGGRLESVGETLKVEGGVEKGNERSGKEQKEGENGDAKGNQKAEEKQELVS
ncbi:MAG: Non-classical phosphatidylinositol transfer protein (PITP) [Bathelium mastoideum]|nr:MAG: Non-classical phosphatidylinositol transfer protein (PITP) [Bathelium mastoideum]KAI9688726.1 MAG: Non-classical phosphatidylinositol transfer protein (PITP) [Bathelium mastoideum]